MTDRIYDEVARRIREMRRGQNLALEELAHRAGITASYLGQIERGERKLSLRSLAAIAAALGVAPYTLLDGGQDGYRTMATFDKQLMGAVLSASEADRDAALRTVKLIFRLLRRRRAPARKKPA